MGTIFKYREKLFQCRDLKKKLKKLKLDENDIEIIRDNIKEDDLEKAFCELNSNGQRFSRQSPCFFTTMGVCIFAFIGKVFPAVFPSPNE